MIQCAKDIKVEVWCVALMCWSIVSNFVFAIPNLQLCVTYEYFFDYILILYHICDTFMLFITLKWTTIVQNTFFKFIKFRTKTTFEQKKSKYVINIISPISTHVVILFINKLRSSSILRRKDAHLI